MRTRTEEMLHRQRIIDDIRITEEYPPFDHNKRFHEKVKQNWLTDEEFAEVLQSSDYLELTNVLIKYRDNIDHDYLTILMEHISLYEPQYIKGSEYIMKVIETPLENMKRVFKKYTQDDTHNMRRDAKLFLESEITKKQQLNK